MFMSSNSLTQTGCVCVCVRVQTTAAAMVKGLLNLQGESLSPILTSLVRKDKYVDSFLDNCGAAANKSRKQVKEQLHAALRTKAGVVDLQTRCERASIRKCLDVLLPEPMEVFKQLHEKLVEVATALKGIEGAGRFFLSHHQLASNYYDKGSFDFSKISDIYDHAKYEPHSR